MSTATKTIDMTPTEAQATRIYAYILANATNGSPYDFGDYWNYTEKESYAIRFTYMKFDSLVAVFEDVGIARKDIPKSAINKLIKASIKFAS
tara:strand:+ start:336 stop:611 length:276 start_codon:yes stop_codon:yes gene_type:complete